MKIKRRVLNTKVWLRALGATNHEFVFDVFRDLRTEMGVLSRVIANAGIELGASIGKGNFSCNEVATETNFIAALAQCDVVMEIYRKQQSGHRIMVIVDAR